VFVIRKRRCIEALLMGVILADRIWQTVEDDDAELSVFL